MKQKRNLRGHDRNPPCPGSPNGSKKYPARKIEPKTLKAKKETPPRLPDGSRFEASYDAAEVLWTGTLTIEGVTFTEKRHSVFTLMHQLDVQYRKFLKEKTA
jgi:hypothetical protein